MSISVSKDKNPPKSLRPFLWLFLKEFKGSLFIFSITLIVYAIEVPLSPYLLKLIIDGVISTASHPAAMIPTILWPALLYASMPLIMNIDCRITDYLGLRIIPKIKADITVSMFGYLQRHSYRYFSEQFSGNLSKKISDLSSGVESLIYILIWQFFPTALSAIISSIALYTVHPIFSFILILWTFSFIGLSYKLAIKSEKHSYAYSESDNVLSGKMVDSVMNMVNAKIFANLQYEKDLIAAAAMNLAEKDRTLKWTMLTTFTIQGLMVFLLTALMLGGLIYGRIHDWVTPGDFAFVMNVSGLIIMHIWSIGQNMILFSKETGKCRQALNIIVDPHEIQDKPDAKELKVSAGEIIFDHVQFQYKNMAPIFQDKTIRIESGQNIGLVGHSGSGKSTFVNLILRLFDLTQGRICIDGQDIAFVTQDSLRDAIGMIPQEASLFHRSLMENIRYGRLNATDEDVIIAANRAHAHEFISKLPEGYQSLVGERGIKLSGGQRQRIAIARAFLKNAPILILDEATSQLDSLTEQYIQESLLDLMQRKTTIVVAHRLSTLLHMDRILVFDSGKIEEDGTHQELLEKGGIYAKLWTAQVGGFLADGSVIKAAEQ